MKREYQNVERSVESRADKDFEDVELSLSD